MGKLPNLEFALRHAVLQQRGNYTYLISPLESVLGPIRPELIAEVVAQIIEIGAVDGVDIIVCFEAMGIHIGAALSQQTGKPFTIARKKRHDVQPIIEVACKTNHDQKTYYLYGSFAGKKLLLVDDVIASSNTLVQATIALKNHGADVLRAVVVVARGQQHEATLRDLGVEFKTLATVQIVDGKIQTVHIL